MRRQGSSCSGFTFIFLIACIIFVIVIVSSNNKSKKYSEIIQSSTITSAEKAEKMRKLKKFKDAELYAAIYQYLADHDFSAAKEANSSYGEYGLLSAYSWNLELARVAENELSSPAEMLAAFHDGFINCGLRSAWEPRDDGQVEMNTLLSWLGYSDVNGIFADCGQAAAGKMLVLYKLNDSDQGINLSAMDSIGEAVWPSSLAEVEYILEVQYSVPDFPPRDYSKTGTQHVHRTAGYTITVTHMPDKEILFQKKIDGEMPATQWVTQGTYSTFTYRPDWEELVDLINEALQQTGLNVSIAVK